MPRLEIALLGPLGIYIEGKAIQTDRRKAIALLAYLAVTSKVHSRDQLAGFLWPDYERDSAYAYLRRTLWELNQVLGKSWIDADRETVQLKEGADLQLDIVNFEDEIKRFETNGEAVHLEMAISLYRGDFMAGFVVADTAPFEDWQNQQVEYFRREFARTLERLVETRINVGEYENALPHARRWLTLDQLNESAHCAIMRILAGMGDRTSAIRQYESCAQTLKDELGITPQLETEELYHAILSGEITGASKKVEVAQQVERQPVSHLPQMPTPFIGRRPEVEEVKSLIKKPNHRILTLIGPGGTGKTRLSIQAASEVGDMFSDGVFFASLAPVKNSDMVLPTIAQALNFSFYQEEDTPRQQLLNFLREKKLLLILDNFEHLMEASNLVTDILTHSVDVKLIVTSRMRLNLQGEQLFNVTGMRIPTVAEADEWDDLDEHAKPFSAVQLFIDRAHRVQRDFMLTRENVHAVMEICNLVHGMPLGLELAAAWLELIPPQEIAAQITRSLDFLETDQVDVPDRQRSIRAVYESSWKLLNDGEREAFLRLCVFVGRFSREAAQQVSGASLKTLLGLANKSWLQQTNNGRFQLHELMRQYGVERLLVDEPAWREAKNLHADYFAYFAKTQSEQIKGPQQPAALKAFEEEFGSNVKAAWDWLVREKRWNELIDNMLLSLFQFSATYWRSAEVIPWLREAQLNLEPLQETQQWLAFAIIGSLEVYCEESAGIKDADPVGQLAKIWKIVGEHKLSKKMGFWYLLLVGIKRTRNPEPDDKKLFDEAVERLRKQNLRWELGLSLLIQSNWWNLYSYNEEKLLNALQIFRELGGVYEQGVACQLLGRHAFQQKRSPAEIENYFNQARHFEELLGNKSTVTIDFVSLAGIYFQQGKFEQGFELLHETQRIQKRNGNMRILGASLNWEGLYAIRYSTLEHALDVRQRSLEMAKKNGTQSDIAWMTYELGDIYRFTGEFEKASALYEQAKTNFEKMNLTLGLSYYQRGLGDIEQQQGHYTDALNYYREFLRLTTRDNHLWSMGQAHTKLALTLAYGENLQEARSEIHNALSLMRDWREDDLILQALLAESVCLVQEGKHTNAIEMAAFIAHHPISWNEIKHIAHAILENASRELPDEVVKSAMERGKRLELETIVASLIERPTE